MKKILFVLCLGLAGFGYGQDYKTIKIGNLEVMTEDFENKMKWMDAIKACESLGDGWRLPTKEELNILYENKGKIGGFVFSQYWSSKEYGDFVGSQYFDDGFKGSNSKNDTFYVRAVRFF
jgi:hypothetical protein